MYTYKVMIHPNNKQATRIRRTLNKCIECNILVHGYLDSFLSVGNRIPSEADVRKWWTKQKKILDDETLEKRIGLTNEQIRKEHLDTLFYDVSNDALKQEVRDVYNAYIRYFKGLSEYPVPREYQGTKKSYYVDTYKILFTESKLRLEKISPSMRVNRQKVNYISLAEKGRIPIGVKYYNPRVVLEGSRFYIVVGVDDVHAPDKTKNKHIEFKEDTLGIDLNISNFVTSDGTYYESITKQDNYIKADIQYKKYQSICSKKEDKYKKLNVKVKPQEYYTLVKLKEKYRIKCNNIKLAYYDTIILDMINKGYRVIQIEDLDVKEIKESHNKKKKQAKDKTKIDNSTKKIAGGVQENPFGKFVKRLEQLASKFGICIVKIPRFYPSSKKCSNCGNIKQDLKLSDRTYICPHCGLKIDRDYNAAINIANYK